MTFDSVVFDLDGTLWDTCGACAVAWNDVLREEGLEFREIVADDVRRVTGKPHHECIRLTFTEFSSEVIQLLSDRTSIADNAAIARLGGELYDGVIEGLIKLRERYRLFIVSNCQSGYIEIFLAQTGLSDLFDDIECWGNTGEAKPENLRRVIERNRLKSPLMVGDTEGDAAAARACGIPFALVEYGFGNTENPDTSHPTFTSLVELLAP